MFFSAVLNNKKIALAITIVLGALLAMVATVMLLCALYGMFKDSPEIPWLMSIPFVLLFAFALVNYLSVHKKAKNDVNP